MWWKCLCYKTERTLGLLKLHSAFTVSAGVNFKGNQIIIKENIVPDHSFHYPYTSYAHIWHSNLVPSGYALFSVTKTFSPFLSIMVSSSAPASPMSSSVCQLECPQVNINTPEGDIFPLLDLQYPAYSTRVSDLAIATDAVGEMFPGSGKSPELSSTPGSSTSRRKAFKSSISGGNLVSGLKRALSTSVVHNGRKGRNMKPLLSTAQPKAMASTGQLNQLHPNNELALYDESDCACIDTDGEKSAMGTRDSSPHGWCSVGENRVDQGATSDPKPRPNRNVAGRPALVEAAGISMSRRFVASTFPTTLSWANQGGTVAKPTNSKASQPIAAATSWFRGRSIEKDKEKGNMKARGKSLDLERNKKRKGMVFTFEEEMEGAVSSQPVRRGASLKVSKNDRLAVRKTLLPETGYETHIAISQIEREKIAPWEKMGEGNYSCHLLVRLSS